MRSRILKTVLAIALCSSCTAVYADEQDTTVLNYTMKEIVVEGAKPSVGSSKYQLITTIDRQEIENKDVHTVEDVLRYVPSVDVRTRGVGGGQTDISMRGSTFDQVSIMINGITVSDMQTGHYSMNLPVDMALVESIEILRGGSSEIFGENALAGAINIITKKSEGSGDRYNADLSGGMYGYVSGHFAGRNDRTKHEIAYSANYTRSDGYSAPNATEKEKTAMANSDYRIANLWFQSSFHGVDIQVGAQYKDVGAGMFYGFGSQDQYDATRTAFGSARYHGQWDGWMLDAQLSYRANYDRYEWHRGQRQYGNFHFAQNAAASVKGGYSYKIGKTTAGIEVRNNNIHSTNIGDTVNPNGQVPNVEGFNLKDVRVLDLVKGANRLDVSWFLNQTFRYGNFAADLGVNGIWDKQFGSNIGCGINLGYEYIPASSVYLNASRTYRMPTFTELYYNAGNQLGSRDLKAEKAWTFLAGANHLSDFGDAGKLRAEASVYYRLGKDIIDWVYVAADTKRPFHAQNLDNINTFGVELAVNYKWNEWLKNIGLSYAYTYMDRGEYAECSRYLDYLSHKAVLSLDHRIAKLRDSEFGASWTLTYQKREGNYNDPDGNVYSFKGVLLLDGNVYWRNKSIKASIECTNITNRHYYDYGGVLRPGAWAVARITLNL